MKTAKRIFCTLIILVMLMMLSTFAFAADSGNAWLAISVSEDGNTAVSIMVDEAVTDAYVELNYDANVLSYAGVEVNTDCVAYYSVNAETAGLVKIAWVSDGAYEAADGVTLFTFTFTGVCETDPMLSGKMNTAAKESLNIRVLADVQALEAAIAAGEAVDTTPYTDASVSVLKDALTAAKALLEDPFAPQDQVDAAAKAVYAAMDALTEIPVDKSALEAAIASAQALNAEDYTEASFAAVTAALQTAQEVFADEKATQDQVDAAALALNEAMDALEEAVVVPPVNTDALAALVEAAEKLQESNYTADSFAAMKAALDAAKEVLNDANATQEQVDAAEDALQNAMDALVAKDENPPETGSDFFSKHLIWTLMLVSLGALALVIMYIRKKGRCEK